MTQPQMGGCCQFVDCYFLWTCTFRGYNCSNSYSVSSGSNLFHWRIWIFIRRIILPLFAENEYLTQLLWTWKRLKSFAFHLSELGSLSCNLGSFWLVWISCYLTLSQHRFPWRKEPLAIENRKETSLSFLDNVWHENICWVKAFPILVSSKFRVIFAL